MKINKNNQTTSTECQYQAENSKFKWAKESHDKISIRYNLPEINIHPNKTWNPWNPVAKKKILPYPLLINV